MTIPLYMTVEEIKTWIAICEFAEAYCGQRRFEALANVVTHDMWSENIAVIESLRKQLEGIVA